MTQIETPEVRAKKWENAQTLVSDFSENYAVLECKNDADYEFVAEELKTVRKMRKDLDAQRKEITVPQDQAKAATMKQYRSTDKPLERIETELRQSAGTYTEAQRIKAEEAQAELNRIAREAAEAAALEEAERLEAAGQAEQAEAALEPAAIDQAVQERQTYVSSAPPKVSGVSTTQNWKFRILKEDDIPREYMMPNEKAIGQHARSLKDKASITGVHIYPEGGVRVTG